MAGRSKSVTILRVALVLSLLAALDGCKKTDEGTDSNSTIVALGGIDINQDGSINDAGIQKIQKEAKAHSLTVAFVRTPISDAALAQLAAFPNLRHVEAVDSPLSAAAIDKLKAAIPEVEVHK